jgi:thioredoxin-dependent peroxiredoxin
MAATIGAPAPTFSLAGTDGTGDGRREYRLQDLAGSPVVLAFYPADNSSVCTRQLSSYTAGIGEFHDLGAQLWAISPQSVESHEDFSCRQGGFGFPLLADPDKAVGAAYGILGPLGFYRRSVFVVDGGGVIRYAHRAVAGLTFRPTDELLGVLRDL